MTDIPDEVLQQARRLYEGLMTTGERWSDEFAEIDIPKIARALMEERAEGSAAEVKRLRYALDREIRRAEVAEERVRAWERQVYLVNPFPPLRALPSTELGDPVPPIPVPEKVTDLLDRLACLTEETERLRSDLSHARRKVGHAYQFAGEVLDIAGMFHTPDGERALDYFGDEEGPSRDDFLPWPSTKIEVPPEPEGEEVKRLRALTEARAEGYAAAREQAAKVAREIESKSDGWAPYANIEDAILAMKDKSDE